MVDRKIRLICPKCGEGLGVELGERIEAKFDDRHEQARADAVGPSAKAHPDLRTDRQLLEEIYLLLHEARSVR